MKYHKKIIALLMAVCIIASGLGAAVMPAYATTTKEANNTGEADCLKRVGLFAGTEKGYELDRQPTRVEAAVMLVRVLGLENAAKANGYTHPFTDVPSWASPYVGILVEKGMAKGTSETTFGSSSFANTQMYATFMLRALGYTDSGEKQDFSYNNSVQKLVELGILDGLDRTITTATFTRNDMVNISYHSLFAKPKLSKTTLQQQLFEAKSMSSMLDPRDKDAVVTPGWVGDKPILGATVSQSEGLIVIYARGILRDEANLGQIAFQNSLGQALYLSGTYKLNTTASNKERDGYDASKIEKGEYIITKAEYTNEWVTVPYNEIMIRLKDGDQFSANALGLWNQDLTVYTGTSFVQGTAAGQATVEVID